MNKLILSTLLAITLVMPLVGNAGHKRSKDGFQDYAEVVHVEPILRVVEVSTPREECWQAEVHHPVHYRRHRAAGSMIVGGLIGGVIGNQFGSGRGKDMATLAGTVIGASIGHDHATRVAHSRTYNRVSYERRCRTVNDYHTQEQVNGYRVTYVYDGQTFTTRLPYDPGERLPVRVSVAPTR